METDRTALVPCPFCGKTMQLRQALDVSDGGVDAIIHAEPTDCGLSFDIGTADQCVSVVAAWNRRATPPAAPAQPTPKSLAGLRQYLDDVLSAGTATERTIAQTASRLLAASFQAPAPVDEDGRILSVIAESAAPQPVAEQEVGLRAIDVAITHLIGQGYSADSSTMNSLSIARSVLAAPALEAREREILREVRAWAAEQLEGAAP